MRPLDDLDFVTLSTLGGNERRAADHQLAGANSAPWTAYLWMLQAHVYLVLDLFVLADRGKRVVLGNVVKLIKTVGAGLG